MNLEEIQIQVGGNRVNRVNRVNDRRPDKHDAFSAEVVPNMLERGNKPAALPDFPSQAADQTGGFFQRRLGKSFVERVGRRFGESQVFLERADEDREAKVQRWRVVKP